MLSCINSSGAFSYEDRVVTANSCDFHRMISEWSRISPVDTAIRNIVLSALFSSEAKMGGSGILSAMMLTGNVSELSRTRKVKHENVIELLTSWAPRGISRKVAKEIFEMGGCGSEVRLSEGDQWGTKVSCISGILQLGTIDNLLIGKIGNSYRYDGPAHVVAIDGIVESVGQIHRLLDASEGQPIVIMAKGFLPDVANTLAANFPEKLKCIPYVVENWCVDSFLDLMHHGISCISHETGDVIKEATLLKKINVSIAPQEIVIRSKSSQRRKIEASFGKDLGSLKGISLDRTKLLLALARFTSRAGLVKLSYNGKVFTAPVSSYEAAKKCHESLSEIFQSLGAIVTLSQRKTKNGKSKNY